MKQRNQNGRRPGAAAPSLPLLPLRESDPLLSSREIMAYLGIGRSTLWRLYRDPEFPAFRTSAKGAWSSYCLILSSCKILLVWLNALLLLFRLTLTLAILSVLVISSLLYERLIQNIQSPTPRQLLLLTSPPQPTKHLTAWKCPCPGSVWSVH